MNLWELGQHLMALGTSLMRLVADQLVAWLRASGAFGHGAVRGVSGGDSRVIY